MRQILSSTAALVASIGVGWTANQVATQKPSAPPAHGGPGQTEPGAAASPDMGAMLMNALKSSPGCLGVDAGQFMSGKNSIVAWFESADAARAWYGNPVHKRMMAGMGGSQRKPLEHVTSNGPVMVIATITMAQDGKGTIEGFPMPISQISIELFSPLPGGAHVNGRLAPEGFKVEHMIDYTGQ